MGKAADNEKVKLRANFYNNIGVGIALIGVATPVVSFFYKVATDSTF
jgi:hypothetical protein